VVDQTGLEDNFNFEVKLTMSPNSPPDPDAITKALEEQIGLKIEPMKLDVDMVKIVNLKPPEEVVTAPTSATATLDQTNSAPHPGTEAALRRHIEGLEKKQPVTEEMAPGLVAAVEEQWPQLEGVFEGYGALKSITFTGNENGNDVYYVEFENAATTWTIGPLIDGKVYTLFFGPAVKRDGSEPSPGLADAIRRELEGNFAGEPAYEIMSPALQEATRQQWSMISADAKGLGAVQAITFQNVNSRGWDVYHVTFANGTATVMAEPLTDGKLNGLLHTDISVNRDGNVPSPNGEVQGRKKIELPGAEGRTVTGPAPPPISEELREIPHYFRFQMRPDPTENVDTPPMMLGSGPPPPPQYPLLAARNKIEGQVVLRFVVDADGKIKNPEVVEADPEGVFEESILANIEEFEFSPATLDGEPVACMMNYTLEFKLD
jgi:TonB family protein